MRKTEEQRLCHLEEMLGEIHACVVMGKWPALPTEQEEIRAVEAAKFDGNWEPVKAILRRGGFVPRAEGRSCNPYIPRKRVERSGKSTNSS